MKPFLIAAALLALFRCPAQVLQSDSLLGFNETGVLQEWARYGYAGDDLKSLMKYRQRQFLNEKYNLAKPSFLAAKPGSNPSVANAPCMNEGFEGLPPGPLSASGWTASTSTVLLPFSMKCPPANPPQFALSNAAASVSVAPLADANLNNVAASPLGGNNVVKLTGTLSVSSRISQNFSVTASNFIYMYAYKAYSDGTGHSCCDAPSFIFNFYDCSGNPLTAISTSVIPTMTANCSFGIQPGTWTISNLSAYTPNWVVTSINLAPLIGSCVTAEVTVSGCNNFVHTGYCYYDALCAEKGIMANGNLSITNSYTSCTGTATLSALAGFSSYLWQGPAGSGVSGSNGPLVTTNVAGNYTLTASIGTVVTTQTLDIVMGAANPVSIAGSSSICPGGSVSLQAQGNGLTTYSWSTNSAGAAVIVSPTTTTVYSVTATNSLGCIATDSKTITLLSPPPVTLAASSPSACAGQTIGLALIAPSAVSYSWSTGSTASSLTIIPSLAQPYTATVSSPAGCTSTVAITIPVLPLPQAAIVASSPTACTGQTVNLSATPAGAAAYLWNNGSAGSAITITPGLSSAYSVTVTSPAGCTGSASAFITVHALPQIQVSTANPTLCAGQTATLLVSGNNISTVLWNTGATISSPTVSPGPSSVYSVTATSSLGCSASGSLALTVNPLPQVQISASGTILCTGESISLSATAGPSVSYLWSNGSAASGFTVSPLQSSTYSVTVTDANSCSASAIQNIVVSVCTGLATNAAGLAGIVVFPNPAQDTFVIKGTQAQSGIIISELGQVLREFKLTAANQFSQSFSGFAPGLYTVKTEGGSMKVLVK